MSDIKKDVALNIRRLRKRNGWTQSELAKKTRLSQKYVSAAEKSDNPKNLTLETLEVFAKAFKVDVSEIIAPESVEMNERQAAVGIAIKILKDSLKR